MGPARQLRGYNHVVDADFSCVFLRNDGPHPLLVDKYRRVGVLDEWDNQGAYAVRPDDHCLAAINPNPAMQTPDPDKEVKHSTGVTLYGEPSARAALAAVVEQFPNLWKDRRTVVNIPEEDYMPIPLRHD